MGQGSSRSRENTRRYGDLGQQYFVCFKIIKTHKNIKTFKCIKFIECSDTSDTLECMKITIYSSKGSAGKTPIAANIAFDREYALGTNEPFNVLEDVFPDDRVMSIPADETFPELPPDIDIIFDLAGSISRHAHSITSAIRQSDLVIVPIFNEFKSRKSGIGTILEIEPIACNILIVATKLQAQKGEFVKDWRKSQDFQHIERDIHQNVSTAYPILPLKLSRAFDTIFDREMSITQIVASDPLLAHSFRHVAAQFDAIYKHIDQLK